MSRLLAWAQLTSCPRHAVYTSSKGFVENVSKSLPHILEGSRQWTVGCFLPAAELRSAYQETGKDPVSGCRQAAGWQGLCWRQHESCDEQGGNTENWRDTRQSSHDNWRTHGRAHMTTGGDTQSYLLTGLRSLWWPLSLDRHTTTGVVKTSRSLRVYYSDSTSETGAGGYWDAFNQPQASINFQWPQCYKVTQFPLAFSGLDVTKLLKKHPRHLSIILLNVLQICICYTFMIQKKQKSVTIKLCYKPIIQTCCINRKKQAT